MIGDSKEYRLMMIFQSERNPIWTDLFADEKRRRKRTAATRDQISSKACGITTGKFGDWRSKGNFEPVEARSVFETAKTFAASKDRPDIAQRIADFEAAYFSDEMDMYDAGAIIGMDYKECQVAIDEAVFAVLPLFPRMFERQKDEAHEALKRFQGLYRLFVKRDEVWFQCTLDVRYALELHGNWVLRCKANVPKIDNRLVDGDLPYFQYDGIVTTKATGTFWILEKRRDDEGTDYISIVTKRVRSNPRVQSHVGEYVTLGQDGQTSVVSGLALLRKEDEPSDPATYMIENVKVLSPEDSRNIDEHLKNDILNGQ